MTSKSTAFQWPAFFGMIAIATFALTFFLGLPLLVEMMRTSWHYSSATIGYIITSETAGNALGAILVTRWLGSYSVRSLILSGLLLIAAGTATLASNYNILVSALAAFFTGLGNGMNSGIGIAHLTNNKSPQRNVGILVLSESLWGMALVGIILPIISAKYGAPGGFFLLSAVALALLPISKRFKSGHKFTAIESAGEGVVDKPKAITIIACMYIAYIGVGIVWTFFSEHAEALGITAPYFHKVILEATVVSMLICFVVQPMAKHSLLGWSQAALVCTFLASLVLLVRGNPALFTAGTLLYAVALNTVAILLPTLIPHYDRGGRLIALTPAVLLIGYSTGSLAGGIIIQYIGDSPAYCTASAAFGLAAGIFVIFSNRFSAKGKGPRIISESSAPPASPL